MESGGRRESPKLTRRALIGGAMVAALLPKPLRTPNNEYSIEEESPFDESFLDEEEKKVPYPTGRLAGRKFAGLLSAYTIGEEREVRPLEPIDFRGRLAQLWKKKLAYVKEKHPNRYPQVFAAAKELFTSYDQGKAARMSLSEYRRRADASIQEVRKDFSIRNVTGLVAFKDLADNQLRLLTLLEGSITGKDLIAYALTELMPTQGANSMIGVDVLDFLLQNAGVEFVDKIPALYDGHVSFGPYQFTSGALSESDGRSSGASLIQRVARRQHIPPHVSELAGDAHHKAAYLFAVYNLSLLVRKLDDPLARALVREWQFLPKQSIVEFIASAHHLPNDAQGAFKDFAKAFIDYRESVKKKPQKGRAVPDFAMFCERTRVGQYCRKTRDNIAALRARIGA